MMMYSDHSAHPANDRFRRNTEFKDRTSNKNYVDGIRYNLTW